MRHSRYNRFERKQIQQEKIAQSLAGSGLYVYKNPSRTGTITLPKPTPSGRRTIGPLEEFQGDSYFMSLVALGDLMKVRTITTPEQEKAVAEAKALAALPPVKTPTPVEKTVAEDSVLSEAVEAKTKTATRKVETVTAKTKKLVLDQPDRVTSEGKTEHVVKDDHTVKPLHDHDESNKKKPDVLLNEHPAGEIIIE